MKKFLAILMSVVMLLGCFVISTAAEDAYIPDHVDALVAGKIANVTATSSHGYWGSSYLTNGNKTDDFWSSGDENPEKVEIVAELEFAALVEGITLHPRNHPDTSFFPSNFEIFVSKDNESWTSVKQVSDYALTNYQEAQNFYFENAENVRYIKIVMNRDGSYLQIAELEVLVCPEKYFMQEGRISEVTATSSHSWWGLGYLTNGNKGIETEDFWSTNDDAPTEVEIVVTLEDAAFVKGISLQPRRQDGGACFPKNFEIFVSKDNEAWTSVKQVSNYSLTNSEQTQDFYFDNAGNVRYIKIVINRGDQFAQIAELEIWVDANMKASQYAWDLSQATTAIGMDGRTFGYLANIMTPFDEFYFNMPTWGTHPDVHCKIAVYEWNTDYNTTISGTPKATKEFNPMSDGGWNGIDLEETLPAGEYLFYIYDTSSANCGLYVYKADNFFNTKGTTFINGVASNNIAPRLEIRVDNGYDGDFFGPVSYTPAYVTPVIGAVDGGVNTHLGPVGNGAATEIGFQIAPTVPFNSFNVMTATYDAIDTYATFSIYKWDCCYACTVAGEAVVSEKVNVANNNYCGIEFDTLPAGEYLVVINDVVTSFHNMVFYYYDSYTSMDACIYLDGAYNEGVNADPPRFNIGVNEWTADFFSAPSEPEKDPATYATYVYENSLDGNQYTYQGHEALDVNNLSDAVRAKFDLYANGEYNKLIGFEHVSSIEGVHTYRSVHNTEAAVNVTDGAKKEMDGYYILTAAESKDNVPFYGWYDENAKIYLSYNATYKFFPDSASENITAVYKVAEKKIVANVTATRTENKLTVTVTPNYPSDVTNVKYGYYISTDAAALDVNNITASGDSTVAPHVYMVRVYDIQAATQEKNIYLLGWISYGEEAPLYTSLITVAPDGTVTVAEA